ncbi:MAG: hypothetical protein ABR879_02775 [Methanomassiliicoccales archaeon]|jgi:hypothetical protein
MPRDEKTREEAPSKCAVCDTYNFKGTWKCECDAVNVSKNEACWKCNAPRPKSG